ncbi:hypothetical protein PAHAL_9G530200 [Panicum hallii]|uniref:Protein kinase domain-containing protein n=1 Tax=Panicum hallii TaxID=206008 RepID=A0A2T8I5J2_9POAL|nr:hypothetical protein PAHAL_9G530200 [Panicum hallii]
MVESQHTFRSPESAASLCGAPPRLSCPRLRLRLPGPLGRDWPLNLPPPPTPPPQHPAMPSRQPPPPAPSPTPAVAAAVVAADLRSRGGRHRRRASAAPAATAGASAAAALILAVAVALLLLWRRRRRRKLAAAAGAQPAAELRRLSYQHLRRATGGFAAGSKLGQGGFGPVFRGALPRSGQPVAVKVMDAAGSLQGEREFHNEVSLASHLLGCAAPGAPPSILLPFAYSLSAQPRRRRMMLVYELMPNGSLQDALLGKRCPEMVAEWPRRLAVARDVAAALHYLHSVVQPPVIHGDVKPSNVLLDADLRARLSDFGLARIRSEEEDELESGGIGADADGNGNPGGGCDEDVSVAGESMTAAAVNGEDNAAKSPEDDEAFTTASPAEAASTSGCDKTSVGSGLNARSCNGGGAAGSGSGSDWWWRQDNGGGGGGVKDYVMEWIRSEIKKERPKNDWIAGSSAIAPVTSTERKKPKRRAREWWREEYAEELTKKQKRRALAKSKSDAGAMSGMQWWERDCDLEEKGHSRWRMMKKSWSRRSSNGNVSIGWWVDGVRRSSRDWASGEFVPKSGGAVSSTPSMRGTVCYVAPEYGGGGPLSEKCDIYSFGVLLLVLISGRRPLQMTTSPMSEFEKASLISWARHLAQRSPARRPSSAEVLDMLAGEGEPPTLPLEFSPSPPGGFPFKSRRKARIKLPAREEQG